MKIALDLSADLGSRLSDGEKASEYRMGRIDPYIDLCEKITLDFTGVRNANSSFINALVSGIIEQHGDAVLEKLTFKGCNSAVQVLIEAAIYLGQSKIAGRMPA